MDSSPKVASSDMLQFRVRRVDYLNSPARVKNISVLYILIDVQKPLQSQTVGAFVLVGLAPLYHVVVNLVKCVFLTL